jgi:Flp pilus assembly protein TadD
MSLLGAGGDQSGAKEKAIEGLRRARHFLELNPDENRAWNMGAFALQRLGKADEAEEWMSTSLRNSPRNSPLTYNAASFYALAGEVDKSLSYLQQAADHDCLNLRWMEQDADLDSVRDNPVFRKIIEEFKA